FRGAGAAQEPGTPEHRSAPSWKWPVFMGSGPGPADHPGMTNTTVAGSNCDHALKVEHGVATQGDAVAAQGAYEIADAGRDLLCPQPLLAEAARPVGRQ